MRRASESITTAESKDETKKKHIKSRLLKWLNGIMNECCENAIRIKLKYFRVVIVGDKLDVLYNMPL